MQIASAVTRRLIELACYAPSLHNTQPWLWRIDGDRVLLYADRRRHLAAEDPDGRNLTISGGAALHHLQFAARALGWSTTVTRLSRDWEPDLLAVVRLYPGEPPAEPIADIATLRRRCTDRRRFTSWPVPPEVLEGLADEAREWDAKAHAVTDPVARFRLELLTNDARALRTADTVAIREQAVWVGRGTSDGIPLEVLPDDPHADDLDRPTRFGTGLVPETREAVDGGDGVIVLGGPTDEPIDWLRTGEGLSALWLRATRDGLSVVPVSLPVEIEETRFRLTETVLKQAFSPHLAVRIGWQAIGRTGLPRTPRRPLDAVLLD